MKIILAQLLNNNNVRGNTPALPPNFKTIILQADIMTLLNRKGI
jgi:hypothetical protein